MGVISVWVVAPYDLPVWATHNMISSPLRGGMSYGEITSTSVIFVFFVTDMRYSMTVVSFSCVAVLTCSEFA